jgi:hypothetical protein
MISAQTAATLNSNQKTGQVARLIPEEGIET